MSISPCAIQGIQPGIFWLLTTCGPYAPRQVSSCSFDVLESTNACAVTYFPGQGSEYAPQTYDQGGRVANYAGVIPIDGTVWIKDTGQAEATIGRLWRVHDDLIQTFAKDTTLNNRVSNCWVEAIDADIDGSVQDAGGQIWFPVNFRVKVQIL